MSKSKQTKGAPISKSAKNFNKEKVRSFFLNILRLEYDIFLILNK